MLILLGCYCQRINKGLIVNSFIVISFLIIVKVFWFLILSLLNKLEIIFILICINVLIRCPSQRKIRAYELISFELYPFDFLETAF